MAVVTMPAPGRGRMLIIALLVLTSCGSDAPPLDARPRDARPLAERLTTTNEAPVSMLPPWWHDAIEASPATTWMLDGELTDDTKVFVIGEIEAVSGLGAYPEQSFAPCVKGEPCAPRYVAFNSTEAVSDIVALTVRVDDGVADGDEPPPDLVDIVLTLPAPTDLPSLQRELVGTGPVGAIVWRIVDLPADVRAGLERDVYNVLDSYFLGRVVDDAIVFGELMPAREFFGVQRASVEDIKRGAGVIEMVSSASGDAQRVDVVPPAT